MKQFEKIKEDIVKCESAIEMIGYLNGIESCCLCYCNQNCKNEIYDNQNISIYGMKEYLNSEIE